jgi:hypothetical protein
MDEKQPRPARFCQACQTPLTGANPRQRFCSPPCKAEGWRRDHRDKTDRIVTPRKKPTPPPPAALRDCPHCGQPVAIVTLLAAPHIARVDTPNDTR